MYNGIKRKQRKEKTKPIKGKFQVLQQEDIENNGIITKQMVFKTKKYERDKSITWKDFEIGNLIAAGINPTSLPTTILTADIDELHAKAAAAETLLDQTEIIHQLEIEEQQ